MVASVHAHPEITRRENMEANLKSVTPDGHWRTHDPVEPKMDAVVAHARRNSFADLGAQLLHANGTTQATTVSAPKHAALGAARRAMAARSFGSPSAASQELAGHDSASSRAGFVPNTAEGHSHFAWTARRGLSRRTLALACSYMEDNLGENFTLDDLGRAVGVSRFHFSRLFRVSTGQSPMGYSLRLRIERAKEMLLQGDRKICEIAMELGFFDQSHFSRTFRRMTGVSPGEYVRMCEVAEVAV